MSSGLSCTVWSLINRRSRARRPTGSFKIEVTSRCARPAPSAIWAAPSAARVSSRKRTSCGFSGLCLAGSGWMTGRRSSPALVRLGLRARPSSPKPAKALLRTGKLHGAGSPLVHCKTAEACLRPEASASPDAARATESSDLGIDTIAGLAGQAQAGFRFEPDGRAQPGCSFGEPLLKLDGPVGELMKPGVDLAQPRRQPGTLERLRCCPAAESPIELP